MVAVLLVQPALPDGTVAAAQSRPRRPVIIEPAALAAGPDGLYFSDLYKDHDASGPTDRGAQILRVMWVGE